MLAVGGLQPFLPRRGGLGRGGGGGGGGGETSSLCVETWPRSLEALILCLAVDCLWPAAFPYGPDRGEWGGGGGIVYPCRNSPCPDGGPAQPAEGGLTVFRPANCTCKVTWRRGISDRHPPAADTLSPAGKWNVYLYTHLPLPARTWQVTAGLWVRVGQQTGRRDLVGGSGVRGHGGTWALRLCGPVVYRRP